MFDCKDLGRGGDYADNARGGTAQIQKRVKLDPKITPSYLTRNNI